MKTRLLSSAVSAAMLIAAGSAFAHDGKYHVAQNTELKQFGGHELPPAKPGSAEVPLWPNLLGRRFEASTSSADAQAYIDQAMMLTFGFNHAEAARSFRRAQEIDPSCAICFWTACPTWSRGTGNIRWDSRWGRLCCASATLDGAEAAFKESLALAPNNGWSLFGLSEVCRARGDTAKAEATARQWRDAWTGDTSLLRLDRL